MTSRVDVSIEHKHEPPPGDKHPNTCPKCHSHYREDELIANLRVCAHCGHHFRLSARERIEQLFDEGSFVEEAAELRSADPLGFFDLKPYSERIAEAELKTGLGDAMVIGSGKIEGRPCELSVMDFRFMGGSMGSVVGEKFVRACEAACSRGVPLVSVTSSGGARMQEGVLSLLQLPKTICAIDALRESRCALLTIMADPTTAGATASFATLGDVTIAESGALVAFTGPRVVQQTIREDLPADFGLAESNFRFGQLDAVVPRQEVRPLLGRLLRLFGHDK